MRAPQVGDEVFVGRRDDGAVTEVFRRSPGGDVANITHDVDRVDSNNESFMVYGKRAHPLAKPWSAACDRDVEATDTMLRGRVRTVMLDWSASMVRR